MGNPPGAYGAPGFAPKWVVSRIPNTVSLIPFSTFEPPPTVAHIHTLGLG